jgi:glycosyltransferase involved in cell wall biosynthesis
MTDPLVSIVTPCYNCENHISRYLDSIIGQTYKNIELVLINDGSNDNTESIINSYTSKLKKRGIDLIYITQKNSGVSEALNTGLKHFSGDYLCWPDPDDYFEPSAIKKRVNILERHREFDVVTTNAFVRYIEKLSEHIGILGNNLKDRYKENQFESLLFERSVFCPICHLVRSSAFLDSHPKRSIYSARRAANWQMLLPIYYRHKRIYLDETLCNYVIHDNNISRGDKTKKDILSRIEEHKDILFNTLKSIDMPLSQKEYYLNKIEERYMRKKLRCFFTFRDFALLDLQFRQLKEKKSLKAEDIIMFFCTKSICLYNLANSFKKFFKCLKKFYEKLLLK